MRAGIIYIKTTRGQLEIDSRSRTLTMLERRVLILVNGERDLEQLQKLSRSEDFDRVVTRLAREGFIQQADATPPSRPPAREAPPPARPSVLNTEARDFMVHILATFTNRVRVSKLLKAVSEASSDDDLRGHIDAWHAAVAASPSGASEVEGLRAKLDGMLKTRQ